MSTRPIRCASAAMTLVILALGIGGCANRSRQEPEMPPVPPGPMPSKNYFEDLGAGMQLEMVWIPGGKFMMGSPLSPEELAALYPAGGADPKDFEDELPRHEVTVKGFWIGRYEITTDQYKRIKWRAPSPAKEIRDPADGLLYLDADVYCRSLSEQTKKRYRLPTEAEWEYACRAGAPGLFSFGEPKTETVDRHVWHQGNSDGRAHMAGTSYANPWGLFDMHGNVAEWTLSMHRPYPYRADDGRNAPEGHGDRVVRGGSYRDPWAACRSTIRRHQIDRAGFRVVCEAWTQD